MTTEIAIRLLRQLTSIGMVTLPPAIAAEGPTAAERFVEFFTANIRNKNTRQAYARAVWDFFAWCERHQLRLQQITPSLVASYIEQLNHERAAPTVKQHLAAVRMLFDWLVIGQVMPFNPATSVRGPKHVVKKGKTPVLDVEQVRQLIESIDIGTPDAPKIVGLRDRALIGVMVYSFARIGAVLNMDVKDYWWDGRRFRFRLHEKGGKEHEVPAHQKARDYMHDYIEAAGIRGDKDGPLFRTVGHRPRKPRTGRVHATEALRLHPTEALLMIKRRARAAGLPDRISNHTFRASGITAYLQGGGTLEWAQQIAAHESPRTTKLYDRRSDEVTEDEIEKIPI